MVRQIKCLSPWFDDTCHGCSSGTTDNQSGGDRTAWINQVRSMHSLYLWKENLYWTSCIAANMGNTRKMWSSISFVLKDKDPSVTFLILTADHQSNHSFSLTRLRLFVMRQKILMPQSTLHKPMTVFSPISESTHWMRCIVYSAQLTRQNLFARPDTHLHYAGICGHCPADHLDNVQQIAE
jgi:hypothetical protein